ncbi:MAG: flagellar filament capping protein FliD [Planctomycetota bacterium]
MAIIAEEKGERPEVVWTQLNTTPLSSNQSVRRIALMQHFAAQTPLKTLRDGRGIRTTDGIDIKLDLRDNSSYAIDFGNLASGGASPTIDDLIDAVETETGGKVTVEIRSDDQLRFRDNTSGGNPFVITNAGDSRAASDLGIVETSNSGNIDSNTLTSGLRSVRLDALNGPNGIGPGTSQPLGNLAIRDRRGAVANLWLGNAETLDDVIQTINSSFLSVVAEYNTNGDGLRIRDVSSSNNATLAVGSFDQTANRLGLGNAATRTPSGRAIEGASLRLQTIHEQTPLTSAGVSGGSFQIIDTAGNTAAVNLTAEGITTYGQLVDRINSLPISVTADFHPDGEGIRLIDNAGGAGPLSVADVNGNAAERLGLTRDAVQESPGGGAPSTSIIHATLGESIQILASDSLQDIVDRVNADSSTVRASIVEDTSTGDFRIELQARAAGADGQFRVASEGFVLRSDLQSTGQDAQISVTSGDSAAPQIYESADGVFETGVIAAGVSLKVNDLVDETVDINLAVDRNSITDTVGTLVDQFNALRERIDNLTFFDAATGQSGILFGSTQTLQIETAFSRLLTGTFRTDSGGRRSLRDVGLSLDEDGKLQLDEEKLRQAVDDDPTLVNELFTDENDGLSARINQVADRFAAAETGSLLLRSQTIGESLDLTSRQIDQWNERLVRQRDRLTAMFISTEQAIARIQQNQAAIGSIQPISFASSRSSQQS